MACPRGIFATDIIDGSRIGKTVIQRVAVNVGCARRQDRNDVLLHRHFYDGVRHKITVQG